MSLGFHCTSVVSLVCGMAGVLTSRRSNKDLSGECVEFLSQLGMVRSVCIFFPPPGIGWR